MWKSRFAKAINFTANIIYKGLKPFIKQETLEVWKPIHLCWWFIKYNLPIPKYFIGTNNPPIVTTTSPATSILVTTATCSGNITSIGSASPTIRGVCYSHTNATPTTTDSKVQETGSYTVGIFSENLTGLTQSYIYYFRAFATNTTGTAYGAVYSFTTAASPPTVALDTADNSLFSTLTPTLQFTGTDAQAYEIEYEIQVDTNNTFDSVTPGYNLKYIDLYSGAFGSPTDSVSINIRTGGVAGSVLGTSGSVPYSSFPVYVSPTWTMGWVRFTFSTPVTLTGGSTYAFVVTRSSSYQPSNNYVISQSMSSVYSGGTSYTNDTSTGGGGWTNLGLDITFRFYDENTTLIFSQDTGGDTTGGINGNPGYRGEAGQTFTVGTPSPLLDLVSDTDDHANWSGTGDPHPWPSGNQITFSVPSDSISDSYPESNKNNVSAMGMSGTYNENGQSFQATIDGKITKAVFYLSKSSGTTNINLVAKLYSHSGTFGTSSVGGTLLATSDIVNSSTIPDDPTFSLINFAFSGGEQYSMTYGTYYVITLVNPADGNTSHYIEFSINSPTPAHAGNYCWNTGGGWSYQNSKDAIFYVYVSTLKDNTYYWRVRGTDPSGSNTWGSWTSYRTFYVTPAVELNIPTDAQDITDTTPAFQFTGTDATGSELDYEIQVDTANTFDSASSYANIKYIDANITKTNSPIDNVYIEVHGNSPTGTLLATSDYLAYTDFAGGWEWKRFTFSTPFVIDNSYSIYALVFLRDKGSYDSTNMYSLSDEYTDTYSGGVQKNRNDMVWIDGIYGDLRLKLYDSTNTLILQTFTNPTGGGTNSILGGNDASGGHINQAQAQTISPIGAQAALLDMVSDVDSDTAWSGTGSPNPWPSGNQITYTVQSALTAPDTYYWRVRSKTVGGTWGAWTTTQSFNLTDAGGGACFISWSG